MINFIIIFFASFLIALAIKNLKVVKISSLYDIPEKELYNMVSLDTYFVIVEMRALEKAFKHCVELIKFFKEETHNIDFFKKTIIELSLYALQKNISDSVDNVVKYQNKRIRLKLKLKKYGFNKVVEQIVNPDKIYKLIKMLDETKALIEDKKYEDILNNIEVSQTKDGTLQVFIVN